MADQVSSRSARAGIPSGGWFWLGAFVLSGFMWLVILWGVAALMRAMAGECTAPADLEAFLPPEQYQHEPHLPFEWMEAESLNKMRFGYASQDGSQVLGYYFQASDKIGICRGLSKEALRVIRMHEEAHQVYGWRH
jgi:hypothetical protein